MDMQLNGKTALVTGSTAGIGRAIAEGLAREGATVYINGRSRDSTDKAVAEIQKQFPKAKILSAPGDVGNAKGCDDVIKIVRDLDILINNAGIFEVKDFPEIPDADWQRFFDVNIMSGVRLARHYLPLMLKKNWGRVIFTSSESGINIPTEMIHYGFTKSAQLSISRGLAKLTKGTNVTVNSILPGPTRSRGVEDFIDDMAKNQNTNPDQIEKDFFKNARPDSIIQRFASTDEVANLFVYVASPLSAATNGAALRVDGGLVNTLT